MSINDTIETYVAPARPAGESAFERFTFGLEAIGLSAARLILAVGVTLAVIAVVICLAGLVVEGISYERATNSAKYEVASISFTPRFSNVLLNGRAQHDGDPITTNRASAESKAKDQLLADRLAYMNQIGICISKDGKCGSLLEQKRSLSEDWRNYNSRTQMPQGSAVSYANTVNIPDVSSYYGDYGFTDQDASLKAEWNAVNECIGEYKSKNGNLYLQKEPILFGAVVAQCDKDYSQALSDELKSRPANWTFVDAGQVYALALTMGGLFTSIILVALTTIFFRLEVSFRALRNLDRLKQN